SSTPNSSARCSSAISSRPTPKWCARRDRWCSWKSKCSSRTASSSRRTGFGRFSKNDSPPPNKLALGRAQARPGWGRALRPILLQIAALHHRAGQGMADNVFGKLCAFDQRVEIDAGFDADLVAHEHQIFGADIAGGALVPGARTGANAGD